MKLAYALLLSLLTLSLAANAGDFKLELGDSAPPFLGKTPAGEKIDLTNFAEKLVVVSFWATWCEPCLEELPILENLQNRLGHETIEVVAVNFKEDARRFKKISKKLNTYSLTLTHDRRGAISNKYGVKAIPHLFLIGKTGKIVYQQLGYEKGNVDGLVAALNEQLAN